MVDSAIVVKDLKKSYGDFLAVNEISFEVISITKGFIAGFISGFDTILDSVSSII